MRRILTILTLVLMLIILLYGTLTFLVEKHPFRPGENFYRWQQLAESLRLRIAVNPERRAEIALDLLARRLTDFDEAETISSQVAAVKSIEEALVEAEWLVKLTSGSLQGHLEAMLFHLDDALQVALDAEPLLGEIGRAHV